MTIKTPIDGLEIMLNKVVKDKRGVLCELAPGGFENPLFSHGIKNVYASLALDKSPRAGHYHYRNIEHFYTLRGTAIWLFKDYREKSPTFGKIYAVVVGFEKGSVDGVPSYSIEEGSMAQLIVPAEVYHVFIPLTDKPALVVALASEPYEKDDYKIIKPEEIPEFKEILEKIKS